MKSHSKATKARLTGAGLLGIEARAAVDCDASPSTADDQIRCEEDRRAIVREVKALLRERAVLLETLKHARDALALAAEDDG